MEYMDMQRIDLPHTIHLVDHILDMHNMRCDECLVANVRAGKSTSNNSTSNENVIPSTSKEFLIVSQIPFNSKSTSGLISAFLKKRE